MRGLGENDVEVRAIGRSQEKYRREDHTDRRTRFGEDRESADARHLLPAPGPGQRFYVEEGAAVSAGDTVGLIEVMKSFHEVKADEDGTISKFLVENEDAVDAGQDLLELE